MFRARRFAHNRPQGFSKVLFNLLAALVPEGVHSNHRRTDFGKAVQPPLTLLAGVVKWRAHSGPLAQFGRATDS